MSKEMKFEIEFCEMCDNEFVRCPKCGNNSCNGGYGKVDGLSCDVCPLAYQYQGLYFDRKDGWWLFWQWIKWCWKCKKIMPYSTEEDNKSE